MDEVLNFCLDSAVSVQNFLKNRKLYARSTVYPRSYSFVSKLQDYCGIGCGLARARPARCKMAIWPAGRPYPIAPPTSTSTYILTVLCSSPFPARDVYKGTIIDLVRSVCNLSRLLLQIGIIGGTGLDDPDILQDRQEIIANTPYGKVCSGHPAGQLEVQRLHSSAM